MARQMFIILGIVLFGCVIALTAATVAASAATFDFTNCATAITPCFDNAVNGSSITYNVGGLEVTASGHDVATGGPLDLFVKNPAEEIQQGLGIAKETNHEVDNTEYIALDLSNLAAHGITQGSLEIGSVQTGETFAICGPSASASPINPCTDPRNPIPTNNNPNPGDWTGNIAWSAADPFVEFTGVVGDFTVHELSVSVPEPGSLALLATGLLGVIFARYRKVS